MFMRLSLTTVAILLAVQAHTAQPNIQVRVVEKRLRSQTLIRRKCPVTRHGRHCGGHLHEN